MPPEASIIPPFMMKVLRVVPKAAALLMFKIPDPKVTDLPPQPNAFATESVSVPALIIKDPPNVLVPDRIRVPFPALVRLNAPPITPPTVREVFVRLMPLEPLIVIVRPAPKVTAPVPRLRDWLPVNVKSAFHCCGLLPVVIEAPVVLSIVPPLMMNTVATLPRAAALLILRVPLFRTRK